MSRKLYSENDGKLNFGINKIGARKKGVKKDVNK